MRFPWMIILVAGTGMLLGLSVQASAQVKIGVVDVAKVVKEYEKTKDTKTRMSTNIQDVSRGNYQKSQSGLVDKQRILPEDILNSIKGIVADISKSEKFDLVMDKETLLYYNGQDITYKVLDRLNKK